MKKRIRMISILLAFVMILCFWGCSTDADVTTKAEPQTVETPQSTDTPETTQPPETDGSTENELPKYVADWMQENFLCDEDPEAAGRTICSNHLYDEEYSAEGANGFHDRLSDCELNWRKTMEDAEGMFEDATLTVRIESLDGSAYLILHDGKDSDFVYVSDRDCYVQMLTAEDISEHIGASCESLRWKLIMQDYDEEFYMEDASPEELAQTFIAYQMEIDERLYRVPDELLSFDYEVREVEGEELIYVTWVMVCHGMPRYTSYTDNGDGTYTTEIRTYLQRTEDGVWVNIGYNEFGF